MGNDSKQAVVQSSQTGRSGISKSREISWELVGFAFNSGFWNASS
jgi:hypothetical protein